MNIFIRVDASVRIGSGHVMRTLTLADELQEKGCEVIFICRELQGNMISLISSRGYAVKSLPQSLNTCQVNDNEIMHADWLEADWQQDARETLDCLDTGRADWLIVDHYALDYRWHEQLRKSVRNLLVVDDLADRKLDCDILLDQNLFPDMELRYNNLVPDKCVKLLGPKYALLRQEFNIARQHAKIRSRGVRRILVFFGGADSTGETLKALRALDMLALDDINVDVVVGLANPEQQAIHDWCERKNNIFYHLQVSNIAELMTSADLSLGACGVATWERCAVMLPSIAVAVAYNQVQIAQEVGAQGAVKYLGESHEIGIEIWAESILHIVNDPDKLAHMSKICGQMVDCVGASRVSERIMEFG